MPAKTPIGKRSKRFTAPPVHGGGRAVHAGKPAAKGNQARKTQPPPESATAPAPERPSAELPTTSEGQRLLQLAPASLGQIAAAAGVSKTMAGYWRRGEKTPSSQPRALLERAYGIPASSWDEEPEGVQVVVDELEEPDGDTGKRPALPTTMEGVNELLAVVRMQRAQLAGRRLLAGELVKIVETENRLLGLRHRLEKEVELLEDRLVKQHAKWQRAKHAIGDVLVKFPEAARAVVAVLRELDL
jgi:transcriptional regulator with XRE-family HTH domain